MITAALRSGSGCDEIVAVLVKAFPDREADGMRKTILIQVSKNCTSKERDEKRGRVYYRRAGASRRGAGTTNLITPLRRGTPRTSLKGRREHLNLPAQSGIERAEPAIAPHISVTPLPLHSVPLFWWNDAPPGNERPFNTSVFLRSFLPVRIGDLS